MTPARRRLVSITGLLLAAALIALGWSQPWFTLTLDTGPLPVAGQVAGAALLPLALVVLALVFAIAIAGPVFRTVLGVLGALLGAAVVLVAAYALADPVTASAAVLIARTGLSGTATLHGLVSATSTTAWPAVGIAGGIVLLLAGLAVAATARSWPRGGRRYTRTRTEAVAGTPLPAEPDPVREWDALSDGEDPTASGR